MTLMNEQPSKSGRRNQLVKDVEDRQEPLLWVGSSALDLGLKPVRGPQLLATLKKREHEVPLGGEMPIHRLASDARAFDDRVDASRLDALARERLVGEGGRSPAHLVGGRQITPGGARRDLCVAWI